MNEEFKALVSRFAPGYAKQLEDNERTQIAFSAALTPDQQESIRKIIALGPESFIHWSRTEAGRTAIRDVVDKFIASVS